MIDKKDMGKLAPEEMRILRNLNNPAKLSEEEKQEAAEYLNNVIGNVEYNKRVSKALGRSEDLEIDYILILQLLRGLSHKTRKGDDLYGVFKRAKENWDRIQIGGEIDPAERITLSEFGALQDVSSAKTLLEKFIKSGVLAMDKRLSRIYELSNSCSQLCADIKKTLDTQLTAKSGDIVMYHYSKHSLERQANGHNVLK